MDQYIRNSTADDVEFLSSRLRQEDVAEVRAQGFDPGHALSQGLELSDICWTLIDRSQTPVAMTGVCRCNWSDRFGAIWLLGTEGIEKNTMTFLRHSRGALDKMFQATPYQAFYNITYGHNTLHHAWLKWLGFTFLRQIECNGEPFFEFVKLRG